MLNVAILGAGFMGATHARAYAALPEVRIVGISSRNPEKAGRLVEEAGGEAFTDAMELATNPGVDAVSVTVPTHLHEAHVLAALNAGKHVFVEKPMDLTLAACDAMIEAAETNDRVLMVAHVLRFWPEYRKLAEIVRSGRLGRPLSAHARRLSTRPDWGDWFENPEWTGGAVHDMQVHDLDALNWLFGTAESVYARGVRGPTGGWDHVHTLVDYGYVEAIAEGSFMMPAGYPFTMALWVLCERGSIEFTVRAEGTGVETADESGSNLMLYAPDAPPEGIAVEAGDAYEAEVAEFVACAASGRTPTHGTARQGRAAVALAVAARRSLDGNRIETV